MSATLSLRQELMQKHQDAIEELETKYLSFITKLLEQKKNIISQMQMKFYEQLENIHNLDKSYNINIKLVEQLNGDSLFVDNQFDYNNWSLNSGDNTNHFSLSDTCSPSLFTTSNTTPLSNASLDTNPSNTSLDTNTSNSKSNFISNTSNPFLQKQKQSDDKHSNNNNEKSKRGRKKIDRSAILNKQGRYQCRLCPKSYKRYNDLKGHFSIHSENSHCCPYCKHKFTRPIYLRDHIRTHTGEKPFSCDICRRKFAAKRNLVEHRKKHFIRTSRLCTI